MTTDNEASYYIAGKEKEERTWSKSTTYRYMEVCGIGRTAREAVDQARLRELYKVYDVRRVTAEEYRRVARFFAGEFRHAYDCLSSSDTWIGDRERYEFNDM